MLLIVSVLIVLLLEGTALPADAADMEALDHLLIPCLAVIVVHAYKELSYLLLQSHGGKGVIHPGKLLVI